MRVHRLILVSVTPVALVAAATTSASATPIQPGQHFVGVVNGTRPTTSTPVTVTTVCPGPTTIGPVAGKQTLGVRLAAKGAGYTGLFSYVYAWFDQDSSTGGPVQVEFSRYYAAKSIPSTVRVPCSGTGTVTFSSCPHLAPCAAGWVPTQVTVRFVNIAA